MWKSLLSAVLALGSPVVSTLVLSTAWAQDPAATTFQPGPWQPVARVDPAAPITVEILNRSGALLEYGLTGPSDTVAELPDGVGVRFGVEEVPSFITMNHLERSALRYTIEAENNIVRVLVERIDDVAGDRTLNIDEFGAIYVY
ncbi:MAG: hypothetical protein HC818_04120 [Synechococcaceae cyanobacterium RM1_1_27]|nr:hypothetical protein [Synechococcaceae cyanobacterium SM2_3_2]NJO85890.1 hypothetical protein [Synechococcaceae cyanobacterium RM1_1_27]